MERSVISQVLEEAEGVSTEGSGFEVEEGHHLAFYVGQPGQAMVVGDVARGKLSDGFLSCVTRETNTTLYLDYDAVHAVSLRPPKQEEKRRAGFN